MCWRLWLEHDLNQNVGESGQNYWLDGRVWPSVACLIRLQYIHYKETHGRMHNIKLPWSTYHSVDKGIHSLICKEGAEVNQTVASPAYCMCTPCSAGIAAETGSHQCEQFTCPCWRKASSYINAATSRFHLDNNVFRKTWSVIFPL